MRSLLLERVEEIKQITSVSDQRALGVLASLAQRLKVAETMQQLIALSEQIPQ